MHTRCWVFTGFPPLPLRVFCRRTGGAAFSIREDGVIKEIMILSLGHFSPEVYM